MEGGGGERKGGEGREEVGEGMHTRENNKQSSWKRKITYSPYTTHPYMYTHIYTVVYTLATFHNSLRKLRLV